MSEGKWRMTNVDAGGGTGAGRGPSFGIRRSAFAILCSLFPILVVPGCAHMENQWVEDGPAATESWDSPTAGDLRDNHTPAPQRHRDWETVSTEAEPGVVTHWPLYFEDPFVDKGHGRKGLNKYRAGWEDYVALPYCYARFTLNWLMLPVSAVVTPPWTLMESDGRVSRQALGYDHDATRAGRSEPVPAPASAADDEADATSDEPVESADT